MMRDPKIAWFKVGDVVAVKTERFRILAVYQDGYGPWYAAEALDNKWVRTLALGQETLYDESDEELRVKYLPYAVQEAKALPLWKRAVLNLLGL